MKYLVNTIKFYIIRYYKKSKLQPKYMSIMTILCTDWPMNNKNTI